MSDYIDLQQDFEAANQLRHMLNDAMLTHLTQSNDALQNVSWDKLDAKGTIEYAQAHATLALAIAQALKALE